jgi:hypothetical protein
MKIKLLVFGLNMVCKMKIKELDFMRMYFKSC